MNIYLDKPGRSKSQVIIAFSFRGKQYRYFPKIAVETKLWKDGKYKGDFAYEINDRLSFVQNKIAGILQRLDHSPDTKSMRMIIDNETSLKSELNLNYVSDFFDYWIERKKNVYAKGFDRKYRMIKDNLLEVNPLLKMSDISGEFMIRWAEYLAGEGNINNTIHGKIKKLKQMVREAAKYGIEINPTFEDYRFSFNKVLPIYLTWNEVEALMQVRNIYTDAFIFRCYTGIRFSDLQSLDKGNIEESRGKRYLRINLTKQKKYHTIFLPDIALQLWSDNDYSFKSIHSQQESENLKLAASKAGLDRNIHQVRYRLQKRIVEVKPISEIISTHMARRTFARRWYEKGGDLNLLRDYLGHKSIMTTLNYIGLESDEANTEAERLFG